MAYRSELWKRVKAKKHPFEWPKVTNKQMEEFLGLSLQERNKLAEQYYKPVKKVVECPIHKKPEKLKISKGKEKVKYGKDQHKAEESLKKELSELAYYPFIKIENDKLTVGYPDIKSSLFVSDIYGKFKKEYDMKKGKLIGTNLYEYKRKKNKKGMDLPPYPTELPKKWEKYLENKVPFPDFAPGEDILPPYPEDTLDTSSKKVKLPKHAPGETRKKKKLNIKIHRDKLRVVYPSIKYYNKNKDKIIKDMTNIFRKAIKKGLEQDIKIKKNKVIQDFTIIVGFIDEVKKELTKLKQTY